MAANKYEQAWSTEGQNKCSILLAQTDRWYLAKAKHSGDMVYSNMYSVRLINNKVNILYTHCGNLGQIQMERL